MHSDRVALPFVHRHCIAIRYRRLADAHKAVVGVTQDRPGTPDAIASKETSITILQRSRGVGGSMSQERAHIQQFGYW